MLCMVFPWQHTSVCQQKLQVSDSMPLFWACLHQQLLSLLLLHLLQMVVLWHQSSLPVLMIVQQLRLYPDHMLIFDQRTVVMIPFSFVLITSVLEKMVSRWVIIQIRVHTFMVKKICVYGIKVSKIVQCLLSQQALLSVSILNHLSCMLWQLTENSATDCMYVHTLDLICEWWT